MHLSNFTAREDAILRTADHLGGGIVLETAYAMLPNTREAVLRRIIAKLVRRRALVTVRAPEIRCKVYLTTHGDGGRESGVRRWIKDPESARHALETGNAGRALKLPPRFLHDQIAGLVALGISGGQAEFERELWRQRDGSPVVADGCGWPESDRRILVENERMVGQSPHRWSQKNGLADRIARSFRESETGEKFHDEYLVVTPVFLHARHPDSLAELEQLVAARAAKNYKNRPGCGWWSLDPSSLKADPVWHPFPADSAVLPRPLPGIRSRRQAFEPVHEKAAEIDRARRARRAALTAEEREREDRARPAARLHAWRPETASSRPAAAEGGSRTAAAAPPADGD